MSAARACARRKPIVAYKAGRFPAIGPGGRLAHRRDGRRRQRLRSGLRAGRHRAGLRDGRLVRLRRAAGPRAARPWRPAGDRHQRRRTGRDGMRRAAGARRQAGPTFATTTLRRARRGAAAAWSHGNPVDVLGDATPERFAQALEIVSADAEVDAVLAILTPQAMTDPTATAQALVEVARPRAQADPGQLDGRPDRCARGSKSSTRPACRPPPRPTTPCRAFMHLVRYARNLELLYETPREVPLDFDGEPRRSRERLQAAV